MGQKLVEHFMLCSLVASRRFRPQAEVDLGGVCLGTDTSGSMFRRLEQ